MVVGKIAVEKLKAKGIDKAEELLSEAFNAIKEAAAEAMVHPEAEQVEKTICGLAIPVLTGVQPAFEKLIDFDKDGKVG